MSRWYERYFGADYWVYAAAEYTAKRTAAEVDHLAAVLEELAPGRRVLDVGCGTGRHAIALARLGFDVVGVDVAPLALERAAAAADAAGVDVRLHRRDALLTTDWPVTEVDAVVCVQAFGWGTDAQQERMLRSLRRLLVPGGVLVLDHSNVSAILRAYSARTVVDVDGHTFEFLRTYDQLTGRGGGTLRVRRPDSTTVELPDDVRLYQPPEVAALLARAGFEVVRADADFSAGTPVGVDTRYVLFVARAPGGPVSARAGPRAPPAPGTLDLRRAPDEVEFVADALTAAWGAVDGPLSERARRYDLDDPYGALRGTAPLSAHFGVPLDPSRITFGAGATGLLRALASLAAGDAVLMEPTGHPELALAAVEVGAAVRTVELDATVVRAAGAAVTVLDRPGVTGRVRPPAEVRSLATAATEAGGVLVVDESCASYLPPTESAITALDGGANLVVVRSLSKGYCCGGLRVGFAVASAGIADRVRAGCPPLAVGALSLDVALALLAQGDVLAGLRARISEVRPRFVALLAANGIPMDADADTGAATHVGARGGAGTAAGAGDPRLPWVTVDRAAGVWLAERGVVGKPVPTAPDSRELLRLSVPLSEHRWQAALAALRGVG